MTYHEYTVPAIDTRRVVLVTDIHLCHVAWDGIEPMARMEQLCAELAAFREKRPYDLILCLGDYSLDFWEWDIGGSCLWDPPVSYTAKVMETVLPQFPVKAYPIPGNHEQYGYDNWHRITGFPREYAVVYGDTVFALCDTFGGDLDPTTHRDGTYTGLNVAFLNEVLRRHPDKRIFLCAHDLLPEQESEEAKTLICENPAIEAVFAGHIHLAKTVLLDRSWRHLPVFYCGDYSYTSDPHRQDKPHRGFRVLELGEGFSTDYICG